ncbi:class I SAM-dependent methyltransferase [Candidatus Enterococcus ferrettii]|uniref:Methyltransferase domain-containing protein n=1 Tax=Candidatus Enterococcus ferrettii TaxID=2815324 RepID=A0ABV0ETX8_9ENTE|nr:class I SAM-dependent methyltransferase [Enterococcus sp. 665A]MBO1341750.1 class I SAM-dependent methyltransferase [Enterococcus sp. 665A]
MNLNKLRQDIPLFTKSSENIWLDPYVANHMLAAHLNDQEDGATRNKYFVEKSVAWLTEKFPPEDYPKVLDLGCGPGIYAEKFSRAGYQVTGIDFSQNSIDYARRSAEEKNLPIRYIQGDYTKTDWQEESYDLIFMIYCDLGVLSHKNRRIILERAYQALKPDGRLVFDVFTPVRYQDFKPTQTWQMEENSFWSQEPCLHLERTENYGSTYLAAHHLLNEEEQKTFYIWETVFTPKEMTEELKRGGFTQVKLYKNIAGEAWEDNSDTACFVVSKQ